MSTSPILVISIGPAEGLVGGITRHMHLLAEIAGHLDTPYEHFQIGRREGESGALGQIRRLWADFRAFAALVKARRAEGQKVVVHINTSIRPVCVAREAGFVLIGRHLKVPVIFQVHGCMLEGPSDGRHWLRRLSQWVLARSDQVVVLSHAQSVAIGGQAAMQADVVNNAVFMKPLPQPSPPPRGTMRALFMSRLVPEKGVLVCLDAVKLLRAQGLDVRLQIAGSGPLSAVLPGKIQEMGLSEAVELLGPVPPDQVRDRMLGNDVLWLPSWHPEGQPYVVLEALEAGMPVLISRATGVVGEMIDLAADHGAPLLEVDTTGESLANMAAMLANDPERLGRLQQAARALAESVYSMEAVMPKWKRVWEKSIPTEAR
ncbi:MAG: glycosyltransferase family 4 protein [Lautropia sp.]|nr:glycosyltransferase family 4 protein [Lautropia sp.]